MLLPEVDDYSPRTFAVDDTTSDPEPPLGRADDWVEVVLDLGDGPKTYRRELSTMPNWAGSCWYELRYLDPTNENAFVDPEVERYWMGPQYEGDTGGVDLYVGGVEHAVLHLLYARFWHKVLFDLGHLSSCEPFRRLVNQGYIQAPAYTDDRGFYVEASEVEERGGRFFHGDAEVNREFGKIGKSLKNMITPDDLIEEFGADTLRLYEMFTGPARAEPPVGDQGRRRRVPPAPAHLAHRPRRGHRRAARVRRRARRGDAARAAPLDRVRARRHGDAALQHLDRPHHRAQQPPHLASTRTAGCRAPSAEPMVLMLAPLAPHAAEELWSRLGHPESLAWEPFPEADPAYLVDDTIEIPVQINGKVRAKIEVAAGLDTDALEAAARGDAKVAELLDGATVRKVIAVPDKLVNFVIG